MFIDATAVSKTNEQTNEQGDSDVEAVSDSVEETK